MSETSGQCSRCHGPMPEATSRLLIESGPLREGYPEMDLCTHCTESLERWIQRRHRRSRHGSGSSHGHEHGHGHGHGSHHVEAEALDPPEAEPADSAFPPTHVILLVVICVLFVAGTAAFLYFGL